MPWPFALSKEKHCWARVDDVRAGAGDSILNLGPKDPRPPRLGQGWLPPDLFSRKRTCLSRLPASFHWVPAITTTTTVSSAYMFYSILSYTLSLILPTCPEGR